jgi:hypothetical protein
VKGEGELDSSGSEQRLSGSIKCWEFDACLSSCCLLKGPQLQAGLSRWEQNHLLEPMLQCHSAAPNVALYELLHAYCMFHMYRRLWFACSKKCNEGNNLQFPLDLLPLLRPRDDSVRMKQRYVSLFNRIYLQSFYTGSRKYWTVTAKMEHSERSALCSAVSLHFAYLKAIQ